MLCECVFVLLVLTSNFKMCTVLFFYFCKFLRKVRECIITNPDDFFTDGLKSTIHHAKDGGGGSACQWAEVRFNPHNLTVLELNCYFFPGCECCLFSDNITQPHCFLKLALTWYFWHTLQHNSFNLNPLTSRMYGYYPNVLISSG